MEEITGKIIKKSLFCVIAVILTLMLPEGCRGPIRVFKIGIAAHPERDAIPLAGLRAGLVELGYIEGKNLKYISKDIIIEDEKLIYAQVKELLAQDLDVLFVSGRAGGVARELIKGTNIPLLFCGDADPVGDGMVESLSHPGGNITGVRAVDSLSKTLEWLTIIKPGLKKIWMPYDPDDQFAGYDVTRAEKTAGQLSVELLHQKIHSVKETVAAIENLPKDVDAVFINLSRILFPGSREIFQAAINRGLLTGSSIESDDALVVLTTDFFDAGKKTARLAHQIFQGIKPSDIPVETPESILTINLKTAEKIGLTIPEKYLMLAQKIIR
jgi:putative tryptophan/tyrosine transport system substrate-binding protein